MLLKNNFLIFRLTFKMLKLKGDCCGSAVINLLFEKVIAYSGDPKLQELIFYLAQTVSLNAYFICFKIFFFIQIKKSNYLGIKTLSYNARRLDLQRENKRPI